MRCNWLGNITAVDKSTQSGFPWVENLLGIEQYAGKIRILDPASQIAFAGRPVVRINHNHHVVSSISNLIWTDVVTSLELQMLACMTASIASFDHPTSW